MDTAYTNIEKYGYWAEYSVLTRNYSNTAYDGMNEKMSALLTINVFPNPTNGNQTLIIETNKICNLTIDLYDIMGRKLKTVYAGKSEPASTIIHHDVASLPNSMYIYNINIDGERVNRKFIKQ